MWTLVVSLLWAFINPAIVLSMFILSLVFVRVCGLFEWKGAGFLSCVFVCIAIGDPVIKRGDLGPH